MAFLHEHIILPLSDMLQGEQVHKFLHDDFYLFFFVLSFFLFGALRDRTLLRSVLFRLSGAKLSNSFLLQALSYLVIPQNTHSMCKNTHKR